MLKTETTGKKHARKNTPVFIPEGKLPLLLAELAKAGLVLPAEYVTPDSLIGMLDAAIMTHLAAKGEGVVEGDWFNKIFGEELKLGGKVEEATDSPLLL